MSDQGRTTAEEEASLQRQRGVVAMFNRAKFASLDEALAGAETTVAAWQEQGLLLSPPARDQRIKSPLLREDDSSTD